MDRQTKIYSFSKLFQFLNYDELADLYKESGLDGIDLTVRKGGHVLPESVEKDLPKAVKAAQKHGITIPSIVTDIVDADNPLTERVLKTASENGVKYYRMAIYHYDYRKSIPANLEIFRAKMERLVDLNVKYNIHGGYQNHYGTTFGGTPWEIWEVIKYMDKKWVGCFYDIHHAIAESGKSWINAMRLIAPLVTMHYVKDFYYVGSQSGGVWPVTCELGKGMVDFNSYFRICKELNMNGPFCLHVEYDLFNADEKTGLSHIDKYKKASMILKRDTEILKNMLIFNAIL